MNSTIKLLRMFFFVLAVAVALVPVPRAEGTATERRYVVTLSQSGAGAPVAVVHENSLCGTPVWARESAGVYTLTLANAFPAGKTVLPVPQPGRHGDDFSSDSSLQAPDVIRLRVFDGEGTGVDDWSNLSFEVRVYE